MKKFIIASAIVLVAIVPTAAQALTLNVGDLDISVLETSSEPNIDIVSLKKDNEDKFHKVTICHNVGHNGHAISIDVDAVAGGQETKHGLLTLDADLEFVSFVPHNSGGHDQDFFLHIGDENEPKDDDSCADDTPGENDPLVHVCINGEVNSILASVALDLHLDVLGADEDCPVVPPGDDDPLVRVCLDGKINSVLASVAANLHLVVLGADQDSCGVPETPVTTTTTAPPVTVTTTTTTIIPEAPHADCVTPAGEPYKAEKCSENTAPATETPATQPAGALAHTGFGTLWLALVGLGAGVLGMAFRILGKRRSA